MADSIKVLSSEIALSSSTPNTVNNATLVRLVNTSASPNLVLITIKDTSGVTTKGTFTLGHDGTGFGSLNLVKLPTDTLTANTANNTVVTKATSIAYT